MKKTVFAAMAALTILVLALVFAGCDKSRLKDDASRRTTETTTSLGDRVERGLTDASERVSEGLSEAGSKFRNGVTDASEALSSIGENVKN